MMKKFSSEDKLNKCVMPQSLEDANSMNFQSRWHKADGRRTSRKGLTVTKSGRESGEAIGNNGRASSPKTGYNSRLLSSYDTQFSKAAMDPKTMHIICDLFR